MKEENVKGKPKKIGLLDRIKGRNAMEKKIEKDVIGTKTSLIGSKEAKEKKVILLKDKPRTAESVEDYFKKEAEEKKKILLKEKPRTAESLEDLSKIGKEQVEEMKEENVKGKPKKIGLLDRIKGRNA